MSTRTEKVTAEVFGSSDVGRVRPVNEDSFLIGDLDTRAWLLGGGALEGKVPAVAEPPRIELGSRGPLAVVCDGMGGAAAGEVASGLAARVVWDEMRQAQDTSDRAVYGRLLRRAVRVANHYVWDKGHRSSELRGMGTTLSVAGLVGTELLVANIGDSRAYVQRGDALVQITRDQSLASALVQAGQITAEEVKRTPAAHTVLQALGVRKDVEVALSITPLRRGDRLLLCSDGLYGPVGDELLRAILLRHAGLRDAVADLIAAALAAGGPDNATAVLIRFDGPGLPEPGGAADLPRFTELDPMEEGDRALLSTSRVARRLAAQAGIGADPGPPVVPATGVHQAARPPSDLSALLESQSEPPPGPATAVVKERSRLGLASWIVILVLLVLLAGGVLLFWD